MLRHVLLATIVLVGCTATVRTAPPPAAPPPAAPPPAEPPPAVAQQHPAYLHALTDLRAARSYLQRPTANIGIRWDEKIAIQEIDNAIRQLKQASIDDGKDLGDHPPVDRPTWGGRLDRALELVEQAGRDSMEAEQSHDPLAQRLQKDILQHIGNAKRFIVEGIKEAKTLHEVPAPPPVEPPPVAQQHPAYLHALTDLRAARSFLQRPTGNLGIRWDEKIAIQEIDNAIRQLKEASIDDGKNIDDHPPVDRPTWGGRLDRALELVEQAGRDAMEAEQNRDPLAKRLQKDILQHIGNAKRFIAEGIKEAKTLHEVPAPPPPGEKPGIHPAYLHALSDLRFARALLERPGKDVEVKWDEAKAVGQIDAAIKEIRDASIDDGKPLTDHPPVDANLHHRDRLKQAVDTLEKAAHDIEEHEDNAFAKPARHHAVEHLRDAIRFTREAIEDRKEHGKKH